LAGKVGHLRGEQRLKARDPSAHSLRIMAQFTSIGAQTPLGMGGHEMKEVVTLIDTLRCVGGAQEISQVNNPGPSIPQRACLRRYQGQQRR
jgi:hypothetical protein